MPPSSGGVARNGLVELPWQRFGRDGEPLLLVNGLSSPSVAYDDGFVAEVTNRGFDVVRFDNRDSGRATSTSGGYQLVDMAADAVAVLDDLGWGTAHLFGMSMGGMIVQQLAITFGSRVRTIISLMSTTGNRDFGRPTPEALEALMIPAPLDREQWLEHRVSTERVWATPAQWDPSAVRARGERLFDYGIQPEGVKHQYQALMSSGSRDVALAKVETPTLVLHGTHDTLVQLSGGRHTADVIRNSEFVAIEGMGHDLPQAYWTVIADHVARFVGDAGFGLA